MKLFFPLSKLPNPIKGYCDVVDLFVGLLHLSVLDWKILIPKHEVKRNLNNIQRYQ